MSCSHPICQTIGGPCSLTVSRSRGCRPNIVAEEPTPEILDEVRTLLETIDQRESAVRLAQIIRREAMDERNLLAYARGEELDFADALARATISCDPGPARGS